MPYNGSGTYTLPLGSVTSSTAISTTWANTTLEDIKTALTGVLVRDGQAAMTGSLNMGNQSILSAVISGAMLTDATVTAAKLASGVVLASGTVAIFVQATAPVGWTRVTTAAYNDSALRIVTTGMTTGGSTAFSSAWAAATSGSTILTTAQIPSHNHVQAFWNSTNDGGRYGDVSTGVTASLFTLAAGPDGRGNNVSFTGGDGGHTHTTPAVSVKYTDAMIATKT